VEQGFPLDTEIDEYDPMSLHFLLTTPVPSPPENSLQSLLPGQSDEARSRADTPKPIGTIRLTPSVGKVSRLAVDKAYRSYGFGRVLVEALDEHVRKLKGDELAEWGTVMEEGDKKAVRLKLHSQVSAQVGAIGLAHGRCKSFRSTKSWGTRRKATSLTRKEVSGLARLAGGIDRQPPISR